MKHNVGQITDWPKIARSDTIPPEIVVRMQHLRRLMLVHCFIYYVQGTNVVSDHKWMEWAQELHRLQQEHGWQIGFYDNQFHDWDGSTGYHLKYDADILNSAFKVMRLHQKYGEAGPPPSG